MELSPKEELAQNILRAYICKVKLDLCLDDRFMVWLLENEKERIHRALLKKPVSTS